ncbi:MAG: hypothetical protein H6Q70_4277 [Firmicutes bacterium]|nr:hypothetical protein [Bacillota bacterium]
MQITNKQQIVAHKNTIQGEKVVGASNGRAKVSLSKGFSSTPAATFKNSTKDDYDASTLNPLQKRVLSLQEQITNLNSDDKMESDTKSNLLKPLQEELESVQEQMLKQQKTSTADISSETVGKNEITAVAENTDKLETQELDSLCTVIAQGSTLQVKCSSPVKSSPTTVIRSEKQDLDWYNWDWYSSQDYKDRVTEMREKGYTNEQIYDFTHIVTTPEFEMHEHIDEIKNMVKDVCDKNGFDYYERRGHMPDMEAILKKNGKKAYEALNQVFSNFEKTIWLQGSKDRQGFSDFIKKFGLQGDQGTQDFSSTHNGGFDGTIWEVLIPPSADPNKSRDPLSFIK